jgi:8-oxo-dGTP pyrophosphatase MutT (NUDIX family)
MHATVHETKPQGFKPAVEIAACYLEIDGQLLLLECSPSKPEPGKWGVPAGKLEVGETPEQAAKRELLEETGILIENSEIHAMGSLYPKASYRLRLPSFSSHPQGKAGGALIERAPKLSLGSPTRDRSPTSHGRCF